VNPAPAPERLRGALLGLALADALAKPRLDPRTRAPEPGRWSASTQFVLCVARAIAEHSGVDLSAVGTQLRRWAESREYRSPSPGLRRFLIRLRRGAPWDACAVSGWQGRCPEALLAAVPVGAWLWADADARGRAVRGVVQILQRSREAAEAAALAGDVIAWALGVAPEEAPPLAEWLRDAGHRALRKRLRIVERSRRTGAGLRRPIRLQRPAPAQIVTAALEISEFGAADLRSAVGSVLAWGEAGAFTAPLVGALIGARRGEAGLPADLLRALEDAGGISRLAESFGGEAARRRGLIPVIEGAATALAGRLWRLVRVTAGVCLLLLGLVGLVLPVLQGVLFLFSGLAILGAEFRWARDLLRRTKYLLKRGVRRVRSARRPSGESA
jgi:ADP-ribosylglycohydrolase